MLSFISPTHPSVVRYSVLRLISAKNGTVAMMAFLVLMAALAKVVVTYEVRQNYATYQSLLKQGERLKRQHDRLLLRRGELLAQHHISSKAQQRLGMHLPKKTFYIG